MPPIDPKLSAELVQALLKDGKAAFTGLLDTLRETDDGGDWKTRFLLGALVSSVGNPEQAAQRQALATFLLDEATGSRPIPVRIFLLARLRLIADKEAVAKLIPLLAAQNPPLVDAAAAVLVSIGVPAKAALVEALKAAQGHPKAAIQNALAQIP